MLLLFNHHSRSADAWSGSANSIQFAELEAKVKE
jgi:hypothetical protein